MNASPPQSGKVDAPRAKIPASNLMFAIDICKDRGCSSRSCLAILFFLFLIDRGWLKNR